MKKFLGINIFLILILAGLSFGQMGHFKEVFLQANQNYAKQNYEGAIELYQKILKQGYENSDIYYNLGNCYYRLNQVGNAVLYFEKAHKLNPHDPDIEYNLELANLRIVDNIQMPPRFFLFDWWDAVKNYYSPGQLTYVVSVLFAVTIFLLIVWLYAKSYRLRRWLMTFVVTAGVIAVFWSYIFLIRIDEYKSHRDAVVLTPTETVYSAPDEGSTDVFVLHEGAKVKLDDQRSGWMEISLPDGKSGWIKSQALGII